MEDKDIDYYSEYIDVIDEVLDSYIEQCMKISKNTLYIECISLEKAIKNELWCSLFFKYYESYNTKRKKGYNIYRSKKSLLKEVSKYLPTDTIVLYLKKNRKDLELLKELHYYRGVIAIYCYNRRQLEYFKPILEKLREQTVVFVDFETNDLEIQNDNIVILEYILFKIDTSYNNPLLSKNFTRLHWFINIFHAFFKALEPKALIVLEGCHAEMEILSSLSKLFNFPSICIQQGWPSVIHTRFRKMTYDYFLTWGKEFNDLWKVFNPTPKFKEIGYIYPVKNNTKKQDIITFFLQSPMIILNQSTFDKLLHFAIFCASTYSNYKIWIKEHPEFRLSTHWITTLKKYENITLLQGIAIEDIYSSTKITVSVFSSTIMEGVAHGVIPFVYNISSHNYNPYDIESKQIGIIADTNNDAIRKMTKLVHNTFYQNQLIENIQKLKIRYFCNEEAKAIKVFNNFIKKIYTGNIAT